MTSIKITNKDGNYETFTVVYNVVTGEEAITGLRGFSQNYQVKFYSEQGARQQGSTTIGVNAQRRTVIFSVHLFKKSHQQLLERVNDIVRHLNPHYGEVEIEHTSDYQTRTINGFLRKYDLKDETKIYGYGILTLTFECDEPFFKEASDNTTLLGTGEDVFNIINTDGILTDPSDSTDFFFGESPVGHPNEGKTFTEFGLNTTEIAVQNDGDYLAPVFIHISGPVENPELTRTAVVNGVNVVDYLKFNLNSGTLEVTTNDFIEIDTTQGRETAILYQRTSSDTVSGLGAAEQYKRNNDSLTQYVEYFENPNGSYTVILYTKINLNKYLDPESNYWKLGMGENIINLVSNGGIPIYTIKYRKRYISA